jgi:hypothetical protein
LSDERVGSGLPDHWSASTTWAEAAEEARYLILLFAETSEARNPRRQELIAKLIDDLARLSD